MARGIIIFGSPGSGTTTLGREVAKRLGFQHFDLDDYLWRWDTEIPFTVTRPRKERIKLLMDDISRFPHFVMSGSMDSYNAPFVPLFDLALLAMIRRYDTDGSPCRRVHDQWASTLPCPVLHVDGTAAIAENAAQIAEQYLAQATV